MKIEIELHDLIAISVQYQYVSLVNAPDIAREIELKDPEKKVAIIQWVTNEHPLMWPVSEYVNEERRLRRMNEIETDIKRKRALDIQTKETSVFTDRPIEHRIKHSEEEINAIMMDPDLTREQKNERLRILLGLNKK